MNAASAVSTAPALSEVAGLLVFFGFVAVLAIVPAAARWTVARVTVARRTIERKTITQAKMKSAR